LPNNVIDGGTGNWDESTTNWTNVLGDNNFAWVNANNDDAVFSGTAGTATLTTGISANLLDFQTDGYTVTGDTLTLGAGGIATGANNATIDSIIAGGSGLTKTGTGTLTLGGVNTVTGGVNIQNGTLAMSVDVNRLPIASAVTLGSGTDSGVLKLNGLNHQIASLAVSGTGTANRVVNDNATVARLTIRPTAAATTTYSNLFGGSTVDENNLTVRFLSASTALALDATISGTNNFTGGLVIEQRTLVRLGNDQAIDPSNVVTTTKVAGSGNPTFALNGFDAEIAGLVSAGAAFSQQRVGNGGNTDSILTINNSGDYVYGGQIEEFFPAGGTGKLAIIKKGSGTQTFSATNSYSNGTTIEAGTLIATVAGALGTGNVVVSGGVLQTNAATTLTAGNSITVQNSGTFRINGSVSVVNPDVIMQNGSTIQAAGSTVGQFQQYNKAGGLQIANGATVTFNASNGVTNSGLIFGTAGTLVNEAGSTVTPTINVTGSVTKDNITGAGVSDHVRLNTANADLRANWNVQSGSLLAIGNDALGAGTSSGSLTPSTLTLNGGNFVVRRGGGESTTFGGANPIAVSVLANGYVGVESNTPSSAGGVQTFGDLTINGSTLTARLNTPPSTALTTANVAPNSNYGFTFGATTLTGSATFNIDNNTGTGIGTLTLGAISDGGNNFGITKIGTGVLLVGAASTYGGNTTVNNGTLKLASGATIDNSPLIDLATGTVFDVSDDASYTLVAGQTLQGNGSVLGSLSSAVNAIIAPGNSAGELGVSGDYVQAGTFLAEIGGLTAGTQHDLLTVGGNASLAGLVDVSLIDSFNPTIGDFFDVLTSADIDSLAGVTFDFSSAPLDAGLMWQTSIAAITGGEALRLSVVAIPEPSSGLMLLLGLMGMAAHARRRRRSQ
jgi:autotransporter-associated beta strand protein